MTVISAIVVAYNPDADFGVRLHSYAAQVTHLVIVDNSTSAAARANVDVAVTALPHAELYRNADNVGLAAAQNQGVAIALAHQPDWILLVDDDSVVSDDMVAKMLQAEAQAPYSNRIGILAPRVIDKKSGIEGKIITTEGIVGIRRQFCGQQGLGCDTALTVIASGSLIRAQALRECGNFYEKYFIDCLDIEFCLRLKSKGWRILVVKEAVLQHRLGNKTAHRFYGLNFVTSNHPIWRRYTMYRNRTDMWRRYFSRFPAYIVYDMLVSIFEAIKIALFEANKIQKFYAIGQGLWDGLRGKFPRPVSDNHALLNCALKAK